MGTVSAPLALTLVLCTVSTTLGCSCSGTLEENLGNADFAALVRVLSDDIPTSEGNYFDISKKCIFKTPYGTDVTRAYMTTRKTYSGVRTSCDGQSLEKNKDYLIIGHLHDTDNPDTDSVQYTGCGGFAGQLDNMHVDMKSLIKRLFVSENNACLEMQ